MARQLDRGLQQEGMRLRLRLLQTCQRLTLRKSSQAAAEMREIAACYAAVAERAAGLPEADAASAMAEALVIAAQLCDWATATLEAAADSQRHLTAAKARAGLAADELQSAQGNPAARAVLLDWLGRIASMSDVGEVRETVQALALVPLPVFYSSSKDPWEMRGFPRLTPQGVASEEEDAGPAVVKVMFTLDGLPWMTPQAIRSQVQHDLDGIVDLRHWPPRRPFLEIDFVSTGPPGAYALAPIRLAREGAESLHLSLRSSLIVHHSQSLLSQPVVLKTRARFVSEDGTAGQPAEVIGHSELQFRALDQSSYPVLTTYAVIDIQIPKVLQEARAALPSLSPADFSDFERVLVHLAQYAGMVQQSGVFKGSRVHEVNDFQKDLLRQLRMTALGSEVREGERLAGGILDLHYRNIVIELKVETSTSDRAALRAKYIDQTTQYTAHSVPLSVTCILDMVEKERPPANAANNITLETPLLHGFEATAAEYPSKVAVIIIDGNLRSPSSYS